MTDSLSSMTDMQHRIADEVEAKARELMTQEDGLGEMQAYRVAQMQRFMRGTNKNTR